MEKRNILFLHGFASSARTTKAQYLQEQLAARPEVVYEAVDLNPTPKDFEYMTVTGHINRLRQYVLDHGLDRFSLIGSSLGGLVAVHYAHRFGEVDRLLLLAPALVWLFGTAPEDELKSWAAAGVSPVFHFGFEQELPLRYDLHVDGLRYDWLVPPSAPTLILHGSEDVVVPVEGSRAYAARFPQEVRLVELDVGHDLNAFLDVIWQHVEAFLLYDQT